MELHKEIGIEDALNMIYQESNNYPPYNNVATALYNLKIFSLNSFIHEVCIDKTKIQNTINIKDPVNFSKFVHELSTIALIEPMITSTTYSNEILSLGCDKLDSVLRGGIRTKMITEITGESGCGKTQISLQLLLQTTLPFDKGGLEGKSIYFTTKDVPFNRLKQMASLSYESDPNILDKVIIQNIQTEADLYENLEKLLLAIVKENIKLILIDSITSLFRISSQKQELFKRSESLFQISSFLKDMAYTHDLCIVVINEVSSVMTESNSLLFGERVKPSLGLSWENWFELKKKLNFEVSMFASFLKIQK
jgi:DNA-repair protein XRCC3